MAKNLEDFVAIAGKTAFCYNWQKTESILLQLEENVNHFVTISRKPKIFCCNWQKI
jgi:hypothetical protein